MSKERDLQKKYGTQKRAERFYAKQMRHNINDEMREFIGTQEFLFLSTSDASGNCDCAIRVGEPGFIKVIDEERIAYPEYRGNGVYASLGNIEENPHVGLLMVDFFDSTVGLHINGSAKVCDFVDGLSDSKSERWVVVAVHEAYIQCSKHIPRLCKLDKVIEWNTDDDKLKGGDFFNVNKSNIL